MIHPLVSVGMPVLNGEKWLRRSLASLLLQDYPNMEIIISDNASTDATSVICSEYMGLGKDIKVIRQERTIGVVENFKAVLDAATGKYFMWAAVDDSWGSTFISRLTDKLESDERYAVAQSGTLNLAESSLGKISDVRFSGRNNPENCSMLQLTSKIVSLLKYNFYIYGLFRRELLKEAFAYCPAVPSSDRWFLLQFPLAGYKFAYVDAPLYIRTIRETPLYQRYQNDTYCERVKQASGKWFNFVAVPAVRKMLAESTILTGCSENIKNIVLLQLALGRVRLGLRLMVKALIITVLPQKIILRIISKRRKCLFDYFRTVK